MAQPLADAALAALCGAGACLAVGRVAIQVLAHQQVVAPVRYEDCPPLLAHQESKPRTPTMGGLFVLAAGAAVAVLFGGLRHADGWWVLAAIVGLGGVGLIDDVMKFRRPNALGLRAAPKLVTAMAMGAGIGYAMWSKPAGERTLDLPFMSRSIDPGWLWVPIAMVVVAGCAHAVNLTDGMDGLAAGCVAVALTVVGLWALQDAAVPPAVVAWSAALAGACLGFLWFNSYPASIYLGDVGALGLGAALAAASVLSRTALWLAVIGGVFVAEALSVMLQVASYKWRNKRRIFRVAPIHHHFHLGGVAEPKLIIRFWIVGAFLALIGLAARR